MPWLRQMLRRTEPDSPVPIRRRAASWRSAHREGELRHALAEDPNDADAFAALAELVRRRAVDGDTSRNPLRAPEMVQERERQANLAVWALAEELAGQTRAWFPLIELARLSIGDDHEGALRRLITAAERDPSGRALSAGMALLRANDLPGEALNLGVGHARVREHDLSVGAELVHAALAAGRPDEARTHLEALVEHPDQTGLSLLLPELERALENHARVSDS
jgi:hypothetical protein